MQVFEMHFKIRCSGVTEIQDLDMEKFRLMTKLTYTRSSSNIKKRYRLNIFITMCKADSTFFSPDCKKYYIHIYCF